MSSHGEAAAADVAGRPGCKGGRGGGGRKKFRKAKTAVWQHGSLARMSSHREAATADAAGRQGCNEEPTSFKKQNKLRLGSVGSLRG